MPGSIGITLGNGLNKAQMCFHPSRHLSSTTTVFADAILEIYPIGICGAADDRQVSICFAQSEIYKRISYPPGSADKTNVLGV